MCVYYSYLKISYNNADRFHQLNLRPIPHIYKRLYLILLLALAFSLPLSIFITSLTQLLLAVLWVAEGRYAEKWKRLRQNPAFWIFSLFYLLHLVGMIWSMDWQFGLKDLKIKLPILAIPFFLVTFEPLSKKEVAGVLAAFVAGNLVGSLAVVGALLEILPLELKGYRNATLFISHIRFSLMIVLSVAIAVYFIFFGKEKHPRWFIVLMFIALLWFPPFLIILRSLSGVVIMISLLLSVSLILLSVIRDRVVRYLAAGAILAIPLFAVIYAVHAVNRFYSVEDVDTTSLDSLTVEGNPYTHKIYSEEVENGHYVWLYVCQEELEREWDRVSDLDYYGKTENGSQLRYTLIRYMTSLGLRKDAEGMHHLDSADIRAVEKGIANHIFLQKMSLYPRIYEVIWEVDRYRMGFSPNDKSLVQRYHYLKAGFHIAWNNKWIGVGTGDVEHAFRDYYEQVDSPLRSERRRRAHNQLLTFAITFGIPGFILCIVALFYPVFRLKTWNSYMAVVFVIIILLSMLNEDTLETTTGSVFFALFYGLFIFGPPWSWKEKSKTLSTGRELDKSEHS